MSSFYSKAYNGVLISFIGETQVLVFYNRSNVYATVTVISDTNPPSIYYKK